MAVALEVTDVWRFYMNILFYQKCWSGEVGGKGHFPQGLNKAFSNFLSLPGSTILCTVTGKKVNRGAGLGLEIPVTYQARGHAEALKWL